MKLWFHFLKILFILFFKVTFWPGDSQNATFGPYALSMDFVANVSKNPLSYTYSSMGNMTVMFLVENSISNATYSLNFTINMGVYGLTLLAPTSVVINSTFQAQAYLIQGTNVSYQWAFDGMNFTTSKICKLLEFVFLTVFY